jgi:hypothetical protein
MTVFEWLFKAPAALRRQTTAPLYNERLAFLTYMKERDRKYNTLHAMATHLLHINRILGFSKEMRVLFKDDVPFRPDPLHLPVCGTNQRLEDAPS